MTKMTWTLTAAAALLAAPLAASAQHTGQDHAGHGAMTSGDGGGHKKAPASTKAPSRIVELTVTGDGFVPAEVKVKKGEPVRLAVTRKVEKTCATEIVVKDYGINQPLPLGKTVFIDLTPTKSGKVKYACGMDMLTGVLFVE